MRDGVGICTRPPHVKIRMYRRHNHIVTKPIEPFDAHCCTAIKHFVPDRVKPSFVFFYIRAPWRSELSVSVPGCQKLQIGLTQSGTKCFIAVQQWASKGQRNSAVYVELWVISAILSIN